MEKQKHTPGPWRKTRCECGDPVCEKWFISVAGVGGRLTEADARLIAAAPAMLAALEAFEQVFREIGLHGMSEEAHRAIRQAKDGA